MAEYTFTSQLAKRAIDRFIKALKGATNGSA
jgi:hypothetical protein